MARIAGVSARQSEWRVRLAEWFTRRSLVQMTGRSPEGMVEPLELFAHTPALLQAYAGLEQAAAGIKRVDQRLRLLAELKAATLTHCEYCIDLGSQVARRSGLSDDQLLALRSYRSSPLFSETEKLVIEYAVAMSRTPVEVPDTLFEALRERFNDAQLIELSFVIALENLRGRFNLALGVGAAGFSEGMVCAAPASVLDAPTDSPH